MSNPKTLTPTQRVFADATMPAPSPEIRTQEIYASAFEDAARQLNATLEAGGTDLVATIRARAQEMNDLAALVETALTTASGHSEAHTSAKETTKQEEEVEDREEEDDPRNSPEESQMQIDKA